MLPLERIRDSAMPYTPRILLALLCTSAFTGGCSEGSSLSTSSLLGGSRKAAAPPALVNTPTSRALQVGATSARATKCGYNFDASKLRTTFLAAEAAQDPAADQTNVQRTYDTAYSGIAKAASSKSDYCTDAKTKEIKSALTRHLAGDYTPDPPKPKEEEEGLFSFGGSGGESKPPNSTLPTDNSGI
jgi:hypothetical protein